MKLLKFKDIFIQKINDILKKVIIIWEKKLVKDYFRY